jgi:hypothetical protein
VDQYVALDVSLQKTAVCVLNVSGRVFIEADVPSEPAALIAFIQTHAPRAARVGLESGPTFRIEARLFDPRRSKLQSRFGDYIVLRDGDANNRLNIRHHDIKLLRLYCQEEFDVELPQI